MTRAVILAALLILATPSSALAPSADGPRLTGAPQVVGEHKPPDTGSGDVGETPAGWYSGAPNPTDVGSISSALYSGSASWFDARGDQAAVPWWTPGMKPIWASVSTFRAGRTSSVSVLITGFCQCYVGTPRERVMDLSRNAFAQLADPSVGLIRVQIEVPSQGPPLPATDATP